MKYRVKFIARRIRKKEKEKKTNFTIKSLALRFVHVPDISIISILFVSKETLEEIL